MTILKKKIKVLLAGPYPRPGAMQGTFGRILNSMMESEVFADDVEFVPHKVTLPEDGNFAKRIVLDMARFRKSLKCEPDVLHIIMQKYRALYREWPMLRIAQKRGIKVIGPAAIGPRRVTTPDRSGTLFLRINELAAELGKPAWEWNKPEADTETEKEVEKFRSEIKDALYTDD